MPDTCRADSASGVPSAATVQRENWACSSGSSRMSAVAAVAAFMRQGKGPGNAPAAIHNVGLMNGAHMIYVKTSLRWGLRRCAALLLCAAGIAAAQDAAQAPLPTIKLSAGMHLIRAEVAQSPTEQMAGLMHRKAMAANDGMLFVYDTPQRHCFWMRNTLLPLTIAFIDDDGRIVNLEDMQPLTESLALLGQAGALRARDEPGLVRQARPQAGLSAARRTLRALIGAGAMKNGPAGGAVTAGPDSFSRSSSARSPS